MFEVYQQYQRMFDTLEREQLFSMFSPMAFSLISLDSFIIILFSHATMCLLSVLQLLLYRNYGIHKLCGLKMITFIYIYRYR